MKEEQRLFLVQARSAYAVFRLLFKMRSAAVHPCHVLQFLQMSTELLGKASAWKSGPPGKKSHRALVPFLRSLASNTKAQKRLGYDGQTENWKHTIKKITPIAESVQQLAPALANDGPNPEYPWPTEAPITAPAEYSFPIWEEITETHYGRTLISLLNDLFDTGDEFL